MNKPAIFILTFACALALVGCSPNKETKNLPDDMPFTEAPDINVNKPGDMPADEVFDIVISHASRADFGAIYSGALNEETIMFSSVMHLPIYKFDSLEELDQFKVAVPKSMIKDCTKFDTDFNNDTN